MNWAPQLPPPPDLLRRFVPTPHACLITLASRAVSVQTNDAVLLRIVIGKASSANGCACPVNCHLIRDDECHENLRAVRYINTDELSIATGGPALILAADRGSGEVLGFIGAAVTEQALRETVLPVLENLIAGMRLVASEVRA